eukprot:gene27500-36288_t
MIFQAPIGGLGKSKASNIYLHFQKAAEKSASVATEVAAGVASGEITSFDDVKNTIKKTVAGDMIQSTANAASNALVEAGCDASVANFITDKAAEEAKKLSDGIIDGDIKSAQDVKKKLEGDLIEATANRANSALVSAGVDPSKASGITDSATVIVGRGGLDSSFEDMTPCMGMCCMLCGVGPFCPVGCSCVATFIMCECFMFKKKACCCGCCDCAPYFCEKFGCYYNIKGCLFDFRIAFPCTSTDIVPCVINILGWTCWYRNSFFCSCCNSVKALEKKWAKG